MIIYESVFSRGVLYTVDGMISQENAEETKMRISVGTGEVTATVAFGGIIEMKVSGGYDGIPLGLPEAKVLEFSFNLMEVPPDDREALFSQLLDEETNIELEIKYRKKINEIGDGVLVTYVGKFRSQRSGSYEYKLAGFSDAFLEVKVTAVEAWRALLEQLPPFYKMDGGVPVIASTEVTATNAFVNEFYPNAFYSISYIFTGATRSDRIYNDCKYLYLFSGVRDCIQSVGLSLETVASANFDLWLRGKVERVNAWEGYNVDAEDLDEDEEIISSSMLILSRDAYGRSTLDSWLSDFKNNYEFIRAFFESIDFTGVFYNNELRFIDPDGTPEDITTILPNEITIGVGSYTIGRVNVNWRNDPPSVEGATSVTVDNGVPRLAEEEFSAKTAFHFNPVIRGEANTVEPNPGRYYGKNIDLFRIYGRTASGAVSYVRLTEINGDPVPDDPGSSYSNEAVFYRQTVSGLSAVVASRIANKYGRAHKVECEMLGGYWCFRVGEVFSVDWPESLGYLTPPGNRMQLLSAESDQVTGRSKCEFILYTV